MRERGPLSESQLLGLVGEFDGLICGDDEITAAVIEKSLPRLKWISKYGIGIDKIDQEYATSKGIPIGFCPGVNHTTVAEHAFGLMLALSRNIIEVSAATRLGDWKRLTGNDIRGKRLGVVGMGRVGQAIIERAGAFGMNCSAYDLFWDEPFASQHQVYRHQDPVELFANSDFISINCSLDDSTRNLVCRQTIEKMKDGAVLINCARGEIVNSDDVAAALHSGKLGGFAADVLEVEPPPADHVLLSAPNSIITPHIGSRTHESVQRQATMATQNLINFVAGEKPLAQANVLPTSRQPTEAKDFFVVNRDDHNSLVTAAYRHRGFTAEEAQDAANFCEMAAAYGIRTHNAIKAIHLDHLLGSSVGGCVPGAEIENLDCKFSGSEIWNANRKLGQSVAWQAMKRAMELADEYGIGQVSVDNAFHYLWGGGYVMDAALKGYVAYTNCTSALAEVVPYQGKFPTLGTNPHSWAFPTQNSIGFPVVIDWATSVVAMGRVQQFKREGKPLPHGAAVDADGRATTDPDKAVSLVPFGKHKGYGLSLINELVAAFIGGSLPTLRGRSVPDQEKSTATFYFQVIRPEALGSGLFANDRNQAANIKAVMEDILGHGNNQCLWPGEMEANSFRQTESAGGLLFSDAEIDSFNEIAKECGHPEWNHADLKTYSEEKKPTTASSHV